VAEGEAHAGPVQPENGSVQVQCYGCSYTGNIQTVSFRMYTVNAYKVTESGEMYSIDDETSIELMYLPGNGAFLQVGVLDNRLPTAESTPEEQVQAFLTQLDTTLDGSWEQTTTEDGLEYKHTSAGRALCPGRGRFRSVCHAGPRRLRRPGHAEQCGHRPRWDDLHAGRGIWNFLKRKKSALHGKKVQGALRFQLALFRR